VPVLVLPLEEAFVPVFFGAGFEDERVVVLATPLGTKERSKNERAIRMAFRIAGNTIT